VLFLDTNIVYRWLMASPLPKSLTMRIRKEGAVTSIVSPWEMLIKHQIGKLDLPTIDVAGDIAAQGFSLLSVQPVHLLVLAGLPMIHRDPFDRLLIAQAKAENLTVVTTDKIFSDYLPNTLLIP
jgi:PIN domain nuclease of toxin-antitoxin system